MIVVFLGPPGCGKGTQSQILSHKWGFKHFSVGEVLRKFCKSDDPRAQEVSQALSAGMFVSPDIVNSIIAKELSANQENFILDGYPRTLEQAEFMYKNLNCKIYVIFFNMDLGKVKQRILTRFNCENCGAIYNDEKIVKCHFCGGTKFAVRDDDNEEAVQKRLELYQESITPVLDYYKSINQDILSIDATLSITEVTTMIEKKLSLGISDSF